MPDEQIQTPAATPGPIPPATTAPPAANAAPEAATATWITELDKLDPRELRRHPRIAGIIGSEIQSAIERVKQETAEEQGRKAAVDAEARLREMARADPLAFSEQYLSDAEKRDIQTRLDTMEQETKAKLAKHIGRGYQTLPEWADLTPDDIGKIVSKVTGLPEDDVLPTFNATALDILAQRRAAKLLAEWQQKELPREREAIRKELAGQGLQGQSAPDMSNPTGPTDAVARINAMSDKEFDQYWKKRRQ